jgi:hypothetical protein
MTRFGLTVAVLAASALLWSASASANTITINAQVAPSPVTMLASGSPPIVSYTGAISPFSVITGSTAAVIGAPGTTAFNTSNIDFSLSGPATLFVWITLDGLTAPAIQAITAHSGFTANDIAGAISSVTLWTYLDQSNGTAPPVGSLLGTATFSAPGTLDVNTNAPTGSGPYSLQDVYEVKANGAGNVNLTIDLNTTAVPEPASLALLGTALTGVGFLRRRLF